MLNILFMRFFFKYCCHACEGYLVTFSNHSCIVKRSEHEIESLCEVCLFPYINKSTQRLLPWKISSFVNFPSRADIKCILFMMFTFLVIAEGNL